VTILDRRSDLFRVRIDSSLYSEDVVFKCFYWYGGAYTVDIAKGDDGGSLVVSLVPKNRSMTHEALDSLEAKVKQDLLDFKTRDIVSKETKVVRELLVAKAFAHSDQFDSPPPGRVGDPLGFDPGAYGPGNR
jgi:His-Xaa-Ser system protein HxsD